MNVFAELPWLAVGVVAALFSSKVRSCLGWLVAALAVVLVVGVVGYVVLHAALDSGPPAALLGERLVSPRHAAP